MDGPRRWRDEYERLRTPRHPLRDDVGHPGGAGVRRRTVSRPVPEHAVAYVVDAPLEAVDDADVRRLRHGADTNERFPRPAARLRCDRPVDRARPAHADGRTSDDPWSVGEVGKAGVAVGTLLDMEDLFAGIDLAKATTSMTINGPAAVTWR